jgi:hypothetical protein
MNNNFFTRNVALVLVLKFYRKLTVAVWATDFWENVFFFDTNSVKLFVRHKRFLKSESSINLCFTLIFIFLKKIQGIVTQETWIVISTCCLSILYDLRDAHSQSGFHRNQKFLFRIEENRLVKRTSWVFCANKSNK